MLKRRLSPVETFTVQSWLTVFRPFGLVTTDSVA